MDTESKPEEEDDVKVDEDVDQKFEQKMKILRELGLYDDRMMDKVNLIKEMDANPTIKIVPKGQLRRQYQVLGRPDVQPERLQEFTGEDEDPSGAQKFKPIEGNGLKWSLPVIKRDRPYKRHLDPQSSSSSSYQYSNQRDGYSEGDDSKRQDYKRVRMNGDRKPTDLHKFFESRRPKPEENKTETITDIDAFIRDCNKKAEKPKPQSNLMDDIDDFVAKYEQKLKEITAKLSKGSK